MTATGDGPEAEAMAHELGRTLARAGRTILVGLGADRGDADDTPRTGFTDLVTGDASFVEIIEREPGSRLHLVTAGTLDPSVLPAEEQGVDVALEAFDQTYDWVICVLSDEPSAGLLDFFAPRADAVVIASDEEPESDPLVTLYERARGAGAPEVIVARENAPAEIRDVA